MKVAKKQLAQIIKEEISKVLQERDQEDPFQQKIDDDIATIADPGEQEIVRNLVNRAQEIGGEAAIREIPRDTKMSIGSFSERILSILLKDIEQRQRVLKPGSQTSQQAPLGQS